MNVGRTERASDARPVYSETVAAKERARKVVDETSYVRCAAGQGIIREEVWEDESGAAVRYNLAFINHFLTRADNGRVLGYDNSHGFHHRHFKGASTAFRFVSYEALSEQFFLEVEEMRKEKR